MACPTCDHSLACMASGHNEAAYYHCPRCGTNVITCLHTGRVQAVYVPKLVERCREFRRYLFPHHAALWERLGIEEAIHKPEDRTT